jgi:hypothetical protein
MEYRRGSVLVADSLAFPPVSKEAPAETPLHVAADDGDADAVRRLLYAGENPNAVNARGKVRRERGKGGEGRIIRGLVLCVAGR